MGDYASLIYLGILLVVVVGWLFAYSRTGVGKTLQMMLVWGFIFLGTIAAYGLWNDISSALWPPQQVTTENSITVPRQSDGHFYLTVEINGTPIRFLTDTGATDLVLTRADAARVGIDLDNLAFLGRANTANGQVSTARVRLKNVVLGDFRQRNVSASVNGGEMEGSLLGMSYLSRFARIEIVGNALILHY